MSRIPHGENPRRTDWARTCDTVVISAVAAGCFWAVSLVATREHQIVGYDVIASAPAGWGFFVLPVWKLVSILLVSIALAVMCRHSAQRQRRWLGTAERWLLSAYGIPLLDLLRALGVPIAYTCFEPLLLTGIAGAAVTALVRHRPGAFGEWVATRFAGRFATRFRDWIPWVVTWVLAAAAGGWWYLQGCRAYDEFMLGYHDFGHFAYRVASTWEGRGFLLETPSLPAFWDHFNPGLALLAPLWALWPDARLFLLLQALCLALPAPLVFRIARAWGVSAGGAATWAAVYLAFPAVGQLNLNYSYGWHPISLALPLMFAAVAVLQARRYGWAAALAVLACSFEEAVIVALACLALALGLHAWWSRRDAACAVCESRPEAVLARCLPAGIWLAIWAALTIAFVLIAKYAAFTQYQTGRFEDLGDSGLEIALSPLLRPRVFWGQVLSHNSLLFLFTLLLPLTPAALLKGRMVLLAAVFPLGLLLGWNHPPAKSIAFQYVTTLLPILLLAAMTGARRWAAGRQATASTSSAAGAGDLAVGLPALASCLVAATFFGALPWSSPTLTIMRAQTYQVDGGPSEKNPRRPGTAGHQAIRDAVALVSSRQSSVLASGRIAAHLLNVRRLETVAGAIDRWDALRAEAGTGRSSTQVFDWIVLDTRERFQQSWEKMQFILDDAERAGFRQQGAWDGILVLAAERKWSKK